MVETEDGITANGATLLSINAKLADSIVDNYDDDDVERMLREITSANWTRYDDEQPGDR